MLEYLQNNGIKFGYNINAYTSFDETVYYLTDIPTNNKNLMDSCLLVLHDWSNAISLEPEEIEKERGEFGKSGARVVVHNSVCGNSSCPLCIRIASMPNVCLSAQSM